MLFPWLPRIRREPLSQVPAVTKRTMQVVDSRRYEERCLPGGIGKRSEQTMQGSGLVSRRGRLGRLGKGTSFTQELSR